MHKLRYQLYGTEGCHLCELAKVLVEESGKGAEVSEVDIVDDEVLAERYGTTIPVIKDMPSGLELNWPFDAEQLNAFFANDVNR